MKTGTQLIATERKRQVRKEGWDSFHDDEHDWNEMAQAAICYVKAGMQADRCPVRGIRPQDGWPWDDEYWKPEKDAVRNLVKAGALIAAEIDRIQRRGKE